MDDNWDAKSESIRETSFVSLMLKAVNRLSKLFNDEFVAVKSLACLPIWSLKLSSIVLNETSKAVKCVSWLSNVVLIAATSDASLAIWASKLSLIVVKSCEKIKRLYFVYVLR